MKNLRKNAGFTLIELMVVLVIVGIMLALMIPNVGGFISNMEINEASQNVAGALRTAKEISISKNVRTQVWIVDTGNPGASNRYYTIYRAKITPTEVINSIDTVTVSGTTLYAIGTHPISDKGNVGMKTLALIRPSGQARVIQTSLQFNFTSQGTADCAQNGDTTIYLMTDKDFNNSKTSGMRAITVSQNTGRARIYTWGGSSWQ